MIDTPREAIVYRRLEAVDALIYRQLRLDALRLSPSSFGGLFEEEQAKDVSEFVDAIGRNAIFGAWNGTGDLVGTVGLFARAGVKLLHKGVLFGLFVAPDWRTKGIGRALVQHVIREADPRWRHCSWPSRPRPPPPSGSTGNVVSASTDLNVEP